MRPGRFGLQRRHNSLLLVDRRAPRSFRARLFWFGRANPNFQPIFGIAFPSFGLNFEACFLGAAIHLSPYGTGIHWPRPRLLGRPTPLVS